jgi:filamentous hemagglutinin
MALCAVGKCGNAGDEGGHLIASSLGGAGDRINIVPQSRTLNREDWRTMEISLQKELEAGKNVTVKIDVGYPGSTGVRPNSFSVVAVVNGQPRVFNFTQ